MAIVSGYPITEEQARELVSHRQCATEDEEALGLQHYDLLNYPDGHVVVECLGCGSVIIEFYREGE